MKKIKTMEEKNYKEKNTRKIYMGIKWKRRRRRKKKRNPSSFMITKNRIKKIFINAE